MIYTLADKDDLKGVSFCCGNEYIDGYFKDGKFLSDFDVVSYCFWADAKKEELVGIASLSCSGIIIRSADQFNITPAVEVKIFAIDERYQHKAFPEADDGGHWSDYCWYYLLNIIYDITDFSCGAGHVVLYSVKDAESFYRRQHLSSFQSLMQMPSNYVIDDCVPMFLKL